MWNPSHWSSYIKGALCYILSSQFEGNQTIHTALGLNSSSKSKIGLRFLVSNEGPYALPASGGLSSSAALTGAFIMCLFDLLGLQISLDQLAQSDFGEYYLGKYAGAADKMAQLYASRGKVVVVGSLPERLLSTLVFPESVVLMSAECPTPRLTTARGELFLQATTPPEQFERVKSWAQSILHRFSSFAYELAAKKLVEELHNISLHPATSPYSALHIRPAQAKLLVSCLFYKEAERKYKGPLLREWCKGGALEQTVPETSTRHSLIFCALHLLPEEFFYEGHSFMLRKVALYGMSEVERGGAYLNALSKVGHVRDDARSCLLQLVRYSHDGDRAIENYRQPTPTGFAPTLWATNERSYCCDATLDRWVRDREDLIVCVGGFERSLPEVDDMCDALDRIFAHQVAGRISAAGLGGQICIHAYAEVAAEVYAYMNQNGWSVNWISPGHCSQVMTTNWLEKME